MYHAFRLRRGDDLYLSIKNYAAEHGIKAAVVVSGVGSVSRAYLRAAGGKDFYTVDEDMEIVSLTGTVSDERLHLHAAFSKRDLSCIGGHLKPGTLINTTAEIVLAEPVGLRFTTVYDEETGYNELNILPLGEK